MSLSTDGQLSTYKKNSWMPVIGLVLVVFVLWIMNKFDDKNIQNNKKLVNATIVDVSDGSYTNTSINFKYTFHGQTYSGSYLIPTLSGSIYQLKNQPRPILALIDSVKPYQSHLLLTKPDYEEFKISPPDSVKWIFDFFHQ